MRLASVSQQRNSSREKELISTLIHDLRDLC